MNKIYFLTLSLIDVTNPSAVEVNKQISIIIYNMENNSQIKFKTYLVEDILIKY